jgi:hypothetical protein
MLILNMALNFTFVCNPKKIQIWQSKLPPILAFTLAKSQLFRLPNVIEQNSVGFSNSMYFHVGFYTPYFGYGYKGIRNVRTMWPPISDPLTNPQHQVALHGCIALDFTSLGHWISCSHKHS